MAAVQAYRKYGVSPKIVSWLMQHSQEITHYRDCLSKYFRLYWEGKYILTKTVNGIIQRDDTSYIVVYAKDCTRGYILAHKDQQFSVSFREAMPEYGLPAYCYISIPCQIIKWSN
jgi:hypothetical protein